MQGLATQGPIGLSQALVVAQGLQGSLGHRTVRASDGKAHFTDGGAQARETRDVQNQVSEAQSRAEASNKLRGQGRKQEVPAFIL